MATETLTTPTTESTPNNSGEPNSPEKHATVSHSSPDSKPAADDKQSVATETLNPPPNDPPSNNTDEPNPPENDAIVSHSSPDSKPVGEDEQGEKRKRTEAAAVHPLWKTSLCSYFRRTGAACSHGETCRYAHGEAELRPRPDNTWDPTSVRVKKLKSESGDGDRVKPSDERDEASMADLVPEERCSESTLDKCFVNIQKKWSSVDLKNFLDEQGVEYKSARTRSGMVVGFVRFETVEQLKIAIEKLQGIPIGNKSLKIRDAVARSSERNLKQATALNNSNTSGSENKGEDGGLVDEDSAPGGLVLKGRSARDAVTPLAHMTYADQLEQKKNNIMQILKKLAQNARKACPDGVSQPDWIVQSREIGGLACKLEGIIESPLVNGYRNKCEFSVGYSLQGKPTVGFLLGNFREGVTAVEEPSDCPNVSEVSCKYAKIFQNFLETSTFPIWNRMSNTGFWRQLTVREGRAQGNVPEVEPSGSHIAEILLMVQISSAGFDSEAVNAELEKMTEAFVAGASTNSPSLPLTSLVVQDHQGVSNVAPADAPLRSLPLVKSEVAAEARIQDYISNLRFCISPTAFFQVNTLAAERLYSLAGDWACLGPNTLLFDVCCGTGTIGLTLANRVGMVVGIEMNASAVADANRNAEINGIKNCRFVCSKAEDVMGSLLKEYLAKQPDGDIDNKEETSAPEQNSPEAHHFDNVVAIVDPPRVGLHPTVIKALRTHSGLKRLVYISCNPESLMANAIELCTPSTDKPEKGNKNRGWRHKNIASLARQRAKLMPMSDPFRPVKAMAVDLFPHTPHCELVMLFERE